MAFFHCLHFASLTDLAWTPDARTLAVASKDGYMTFIDFDEHETPPVIEQTPAKRGEKVEASTPVREPCPKEPARQAKEPEDSVSHSGTRASGEISEASSERKRNRRVTFEIVSPVGGQLRFQDSSSRAAAEDAQDASRAASSSSDAGRPASASSADPSNAKKRRVVPVEVVSVPK